MLIAYIGFDVDLSLNIWFP